MKSFVFVMLLAGLPGVGRAQSAAGTDSLRQRGELTGARPSRDLPAPVPRTSAPDPRQQHLLGTIVNLPQAIASQLPDLYEAFIGTARAERRQWSPADWDAANQVLGRLNQRYEQVRTALPLEERLRIRSYQGEFHTLRGARGVKNKLD